MLNPKQDSLNNENHVYSIKGWFQFGLMSIITKQ